MKTITLLQCSAMLLITGLRVLGAGESAPISDDAKAKIQAVANAMVEAQKLRKTLIDAITTGTQTPDSALAVLKAAPSISGLSAGGRDADFAGGAMSIGMALDTAGKTVEAGKLFIASENAFSIALKNLPPDVARDQASLLASRAMLRGRYLNRAAEAKADIEQAIALQPDDDFLRGVWRVLASTRADVFTGLPPSRSKN